MSDEKAGTFNYATELMRIRGLKNEKQTYLFVDVRLKSGLRRFRACPHKEGFFRM